MGRDHKLLYSQFPLVNNLNYDTISWEVLLLTGLQETLKQNKTRPQP